MLLHVIVDYFVTSCLFSSMYFVAFFYNCEEEKSPTTQDAVTPGRDEPVVTCCKQRDQPLASSGMNQ
jgi:hypothetical protein